ncbi:MAG: EamA family transporter [Actinomycetota bacterium]
MGVVWGLATALTIGLADLFARRIVHTRGALVAGVSLQAIAIITSLLATLVVASTYRSGDLLLGLASGLGMGVGMWGYLGGLERSTATVVAPIVATMSAVVPYAYAVARGASPALAGVGGAALAIVGLVVITSAGSGGAGSRGNSSRAGTADESARGADRDRIRAGVRWALFSGCGYGFGLSVVIDASDDGGSWPAVGQRITALLLIAVACRASGLPLMPPSHLRWVALVAGVLTGLSTIFYLLGLESDPAATVVTASVFPAVSVIVGRVAYGDDVSRRQLAGIVVVLAGIVAIAAA